MAAPVTLQNVSIATNYTQKSNLIIYMGAGGEIEFLGEEVAQAGKVIRGIRFGNFPERAAAPRNSGMVLPPVLLSLPPPSIV